MGALTRSFDWSQTPIGTPGHWPQSLRTTLSIILNSKFPMFLFWGPDLICFYNDAYRPSLGNNGKHPFALGKPGAEVWPEIWASFLKPIIDQALAGGEASWSEDQLVPIYRNGKMEDVYWTFSHGAVLDESGKPAGVFTTCTETTEKVVNLKMLQDSKDQLRFAIDATELGTWDYDPLTNKFRGNERLKEWFGLAPDEEIELTLAINAIAEGDRQRVTEAIQQSLQYTSGGYYDIEYTIIHPLTNKPRVVRAKGRAWFNEDKIAYRFNGTLQDVTEQVQAREKTEGSEQQVRSLVESAPFPIGVYVGKEMRIQLANQAIMDVWGKGTDVVGKLYAEVLPELGNQEIYEQLDSVYTTGIPFHAKNQRLDLMIDGKLQPYYFNYSFTPLYDASGHVYGVMNTAADVTDLNLANQRIEESEKNLRNVILQAPVAMCILRGPKHVVEIANDRMFELWGKSSNEVLHKPIFDGLPEAKEQGFEELLDSVFTTGKTFAAYGLPINLPRSGNMETVYINFVYEAFREGDGTISGVMAVATDVTEQVLASKKIESSEARFRLMADAMPQFVWTGDAAGNLNYFNQAVYNYSGLSGEQVLSGGWLQIVHPDDREENIRLWLQSIATGEDFIFHHRFKNKNGEYRWQLSRAVPQRGADGKIQLWIGTSTDIHEHKLFEEELNIQVRERTLALENNNKELERSNANLQEFAYAASHDLKEPIRKIHFFADRLKQEHAPVLNNDGLRTLERLEVATDRMRTLVDDLLDYSQVSRGADLFENVDLNEKINTVLADLEMAIQEKGATIQAGTLPVVKAHRRQMQQLFQNLIGNALKYSRSNVAPLITISSKIIDDAAARFPLTEEAQKKEYHFIEIKDNGIGFDPKDAERIFQVFTRLHGNAEYKGTGVGLAIARKVVENHKGFIYAEGTPGEGCSFYVGLPVA